MPSSGAELELPADDVEPGNDVRGAGDVRREWVFGAVLGVQGEVASRAYRGTLSDGLVGYDQQQISYIITASRRPRIVSQGSRGAVVGQPLSLRA